MKRNGLFRLIASVLAVALLVTLIPPLPARADYPPGPSYEPRASGTKGRSGIGPMSTIPAYDDSLDDGYLSRWDGKPTLAFSPNRDGVQDSITLTWEESYPGRPEIKPDPGDPDADPPIPPTPGQTAIEPGADYAIWVMIPPRFQKGPGSEEVNYQIGVDHFPPGTCEFPWDGKIGGGEPSAGWYYWYTVRTNPETGEEERSDLGRIIIDSTKTELRKVITQESPAGGLDIRIQSHDQMSGVKTVKTRVLDGASEAWAQERTINPPNWRWWPDQEWVHLGWSPDDADTDYSIEVTVQDYAGNSVTETMPLWPPVNRTGDEAYWSQATGKVLGEEFSINAGSGNLSLDSLDLSLPNLGPAFAIERTYNHQLRRNGAMGWGFMLSYEQRIEKDKVDNSLVYTDPDGTFLIFRRDGAGGVINPPGVFYQIEIIPDPNGRDESYRITDKDGSVTEFNIQGRPVEMRDRHGNAIKFAYRGDGNLGTITDQTGRQLVLTYEADDVTLNDGSRYAKVSAIEEVLPDGGGRKVEFTYNERGELVSTTDLAGNVTGFQWDGRHRVDAITVTRNNGENTIDIGYDDQNALARIAGTRSDGTVEAWTGSMDYQGRAAFSGTYQLRDPLGTREYAFNGHGNVTMLTLPDRSTTRFGWEDNLLHSRTDGLDNSTTYEYDGQGNLLTVTQPGAHPTVYDYDGNGDLLSVTDPERRTTTFVYEDRDLTHVKDGEGGETDFTYYGNGLVRTARQPGGMLTTYTYDAYGNVATQDDGRAITTYGYDTYGNNTSTEVAASDGTGTSTTISEYDALGNVTLTTGPDGVTTVYEYDDVGNRTSTTVTGLDEATQEMRSSVTTYGYDNSNNLTEIREPATLTKYAYDAAGNQLTVTVSDPKRPSAQRSTTTYEYDECGRVYSVADPIGGKTVYGYDDAGRRTSERTWVDGTPLATTYDYDARGNVLQVLAPEGGKTEYAYNDANETETTTLWKDGVRLSTGYTYDGLGNLATETAPDGTLTRYFYDADGNLSDEFTYGKQSVAAIAAVATEDATDDALASALSSASNSDVVRAAEVAAGRGMDETMSAALTGMTLVRHVSYECDEYGNMTAAVDGEGGRTTYGYDYLGNQTRVTDPTGVTTEYDYDAAGRLREVRDAAGLVRVYGYDHLGNTTLEADQAGAAEYHYDSQGRLTTSTDKTGATTTYAYDAQGNRLRISSDIGDGRSATTVYTYDAAGHVLTALDPESNLTTYGYDDIGRGTSELRRGLNDSETVETSYVYDGQSRVVKTIDGKGNETVFEYDTLGNQTAVYAPASPDTPLSARPKTSYFYDDLGRLATVIDQLGNATGYEYDALGQQTVVVDARGGRTEYGYDGAGRVEVVRKYLDSETAYTTTFTYDAAGRLETITDANGHVRRTQYDAAGRPEYSYDGLDNPTHYEYDVLGRQTAMIDPLQRRTEFQYDAAGRTVVVKDPLGQLTQYQYDNLGNRTTEIDPQLRQTSYAYDANSRQTAITDQRGLTESFTYDGLGNKLTRTDATDLTTYYAYDPRNNLVSVDEPLAGGAARAITTHDYDPRDLHTYQRDPSGRVIEYGYDAAGRLEFESSQGLTLEYQYDECGNRTVVIDPRGTTTYSYDLLGRVQSVVYPDGTNESFTYDGVGNVLTKTDATGTTVYTYDANDRVETVTDPTGSTTAYEYDAAGNKTGETVNGQPTSSGYDANGRLTSYDDSLGFHYEYAYDPSSLLTGISGPVANTALTYDESGHVTGVVTTVGGQAVADARYTYNDRNFVDTVAEDARSYAYKYDERGQIVEVTNPYGDVIRYTYDGSGNRLTRSAVINGKTADRNETIEAEALINLILAELNGGEPGDKGNGNGNGKGNGKGKSDSSAGTVETSTGVQSMIRGTSPLQTDLLSHYGSYILADNNGNGGNNGNAGGNGGNNGNAGGNGNGNGNDGAPGQSGDKLKGQANAVNRGKGKKIGLLRKFEADQQGRVEEIIMILERIINGETHIPPGGTEGLEAKVRKVAAGYTVVGQECTYNDLNQMTSVYDPLRDETFNYTWDEAGALQQTGTADLTWDSQGRLATLTWADGSGLDFTYDADGRRLSKTSFNQNGEGRQTTTFHYLAGTSQVLYEETGDGDQLNYTYDSEGRRLTLTHDGESYWYVYNGHGDVVGLVDATGTMVARYEYDDYGRIVHMWGADGQEVREGQGQIHYLNGDTSEGDVSPEESGATGENLQNEGAADATVDQTGHGKGALKKADAASEGDIAPVPGNSGKNDNGAQAALTEAATTDAGEIAKLNPYRYAGYRYDSETELYFLESRYYDSWSNRFISRDSYIGELDKPLTLNRYVYALNNSVAYVDPSGGTPVEAAVYLVVYARHIIALSKKYGVPWDVLASVVWNENRWRWGLHQAKDVGGVALFGMASLGMCQIQLRLAAFLDTDPDPGKYAEHPELFAGDQDAALRRVGDTSSLRVRLADPRTNLEYAARYLAFLQVASKVTPRTLVDRQRLLSNYNRGPGAWADPPNGYGKAYLEWALPILPEARPYAWTVIMPRVAEGWIPGLTDRLGPLLRGLYKLYVRIRGGS